MLATAEIEIVDEHESNRTRYDEAHGYQTSNVPKHLFRSRREVEIPCADEYARIYGQWNATITFGMHRVWGKVVAYDAIIPSSKGWPESFSPERQQHQHVALNAFEQVLEIFPNYTNDPIITSEKSE